MKRSQLVVLAGVLGSLSVGLWTMPDRLLGLWIDGTWPSWAPRLSTLGETVTVYLPLIEIGAYLVTISLAIGLGYAVGTSADFRGQYRRLSVNVAAASSVGIILAWVAILLAFDFSTTDGAATVLFVTFSSVEHLLRGVSLITLGVVAAAAVTSLRQPNDPPETSNTNTPSTASETANH